MTNKKISQLAAGTLANLNDDSIMTSKGGVNYRYSLATIFTPLLTASLGTKFTGIDVDGGTIDGTTIGATVKSTGGFTTLTATGAFSLTGDVVQVTEGGTGADNAVTARSNLGLGNMSTQANTAVNIDGGFIDDTPIGSVTPSTGVFTTLTASTSITLTNTVSRFSTDGNFTADSDSYLPTEKAVKTYVDGKTGTNITTTGTIATGTWDADVINVNKGGTGRATLTTNALLAGDGTSQVLFITGNPTEYLKNVGGVPTYRALTISDDGSPVLGGNLTTSGHDIFTGTGAAPGSTIGTTSLNKLAFWGAVPVIQPTALTAQIGSLSASVPGVSNYTIADLVNPGFGFVDPEQAQSFVQCVINLQTRVSELEEKLSTIGILP